MYPSIYLDRSIDRFSYLSLYLSICLSIMYLYVCMHVFGHVQVLRGMNVKRHAKGLRLALNLRLLQADVFPPEAADGVWSEDYTLSDHGLVSSTFVLSAR